MRSSSQSAPRFHFRFISPFTGAVIALLFNGAATIEAAEFEWPRWRGPRNNGISIETNWSTAWSSEGPKRLWKAIVGTGFASMAVSGGRLYTMGNEKDTETIYCLDANTGQEIWKHSYSCPTDPNMYEGGPNATPTVDGKVLFTFSRHGHAFALAAETGKVIWSKNLREELRLTIPEWGLSGSPLIEGKLVILNAGTGGIAIDKATGKVAWSSGKGSAGYSSPVIFTQGVSRGALIFNTKELVAVNAATGQPLWQHRWATSYGVNAADPVLIGDRIFISSGYNQGCALLQMRGNGVSALWQNRNMRNHFNSCVVLQGFVYGFDESELRCLDLQTGAVKWRDGAPGKGALIAADGKLIVLGETGELMIVEATPTAFKTISRAHVLGGRCWTAPVLANGKIFCRNARGNLICLDVSGK